MVVSMCAMDESSSIDDSDYENSTGTLNRGETENNSPKIDSPPFLSNCQRLRRRGGKLADVGHHRWSSHSSKSMGDSVESDDRLRHYSTPISATPPRRAYRIIDESESQFLLKLETRRQLTQMEGKNQQRHGLTMLLRRRRSRPNDGSQSELSSSSSPSTDLLSRSLIIMDSSSTISPPHLHHHHHFDGGDDSSTPEMRLSFASSSSTGYSSARSSLRGSSSDPGDESPSGVETTGDFGGNVDRALLSQEASLSESRRLELLESSAVSQVDRIAMELLETERGYVNDLHDIVQGYLSYLIDHRDELRMTVEDVSAMFGCIERIFAFNQRLYRALDATQLDVKQMAQCFIDKIDDFNDYIVYCTQYQKMDSRLRELMQIASFSDAMQSRQRILGHALPLASYLLKPVQRVLKYRLFFENMMKAATCSRLDPRGIDAVQRAERCMAALAERINDAKRRCEHADRVEQLQTLLANWHSGDTPEDLHQYGDLLLEASFKLVGTKSARRLFLFEETLLIAKERGETQLVCKDFIMCSNLMVNESIAGNALAFQVVSFDSPRVQYVFVAANSEQKREWTRELKRAMLDHYAVQIPEKAKTLMLAMNAQANATAAGNASQATAGTQSTGNGRSGVSLFPKYLERRRRSLDASNVAEMQRRAAVASDRVKKRSVCITEIGEPITSTSSPGNTVTFAATHCTCEQKHCVSAQSPPTRDQNADRQEVVMRASKQSQSPAQGGLTGGLFTRRRTSGGDAARIKLLASRGKKSPALHHLPNEDGDGRRYNANERSDGNEKMQCTCDSDGDTRRPPPRSHSSHHLADFDTPSRGVAPRATSPAGKARLRRYATDTSCPIPGDYAKDANHVGTTAIERTFAELYAQLMRDEKEQLAERESSRRDRWSAARKVKIDCRGVNGNGRTGEQRQLQDVFPGEAPTMQGKDERQLIRHNRSKSLNRLDASFWPSNPDSPYTSYSPSCDGTRHAIATSSRYPRGEMDCGENRDVGRMPGGASRLDRIYDEGQMRGGYERRMSRRRREMLDPDESVVDDPSPLSLSSYRHACAFDDRRQRTPLSSHQRAAIASRAWDMRGENGLGIVRCMVRQMEDGKGDER